MELVSQYCQDVKTDAHFVAKLNRADEHPLVIKGFDSLSRSRSKTSS